ncbi:Altronate oxidoreductase [uncultured Pleomorphomonas sp.]|uniref:Altronate oxidoreductase n=1 Tax=uncultured Pleomorphomonas sp. TaxID=442121 RepID=A0A212LGY3_9HYPH|nr:tagaturonate reductase [uncultured Pleomorphomonas sp.]SCM76816.1 Altronate oxidoreductase [uncultured Pleomorphomonas sp.]
MNNIDASALDGRSRPRARILQWGEGNFLRAFVDWKIDRMNEAGGLDWGVVVVRPIAQGNPHWLNEQDGLYTVLSRGVADDGAKVSEARVVGAVRREIGAHQHWHEVLALARNPEITVVISNTTDAGIAYVPTVQYADAPPASFPGKMTRLLHERWQAFGGRPEAGWQMIACELIDHNGDELRRIVLRHAEEWGLEAAFIAWVNEANAFYNTLVDRIVPGYPKAEAAAIEQELGYGDRFMTAAELFHFFVIERQPGQPELRLPLATYDPDTIVVPDATPYKARKVAILNGAHTALCALGLISGIETVGEAVTTKVGAKFLDRLLAEEVIPFLTLPRDELQAFADAVLRRFANPYIRHLWYDISLNGLVKYQTRDLDRLTAYMERHGRPAPLLTLALAAWLVFYLGRFKGAEAYPPRDAADILDRIKAIGARDDGTPAGREAMVAAYLGEATFWGRSIDTPALRAAVVADFAALTREPMSFDRLGVLIDARRSI